VSPGEFERRVVDDAAASGWRQSTLLTRRNLHADTLATVSPLKKAYLRYKIRRFEW
jgi:hypothetical protein